MVWIVCFRSGLESDLVTVKLEWNLIRTRMWSRSESGLVTVNLGLSLNWYVYILLRIWSTVVSLELDLTLHVLLYIKVAGDSRTLLTVELHSCCVEQDPTVYPKLCIWERDGSLWPSCGLIYFTGCGACGNSHLANLTYTNVPRYTTLLMQRDKNRLLLGKCYSFNVIATFLLHCHVLPSHTFSLITTWDKQGAHFHRKCLKVTFRSVFFLTNSITDWSSNIV